MPGTTLATAADMQAITDGLTAAGMDAHLETTCCTRYVVAAPAHSRREGTGGIGGTGGIEVIVDDDGYVELKWWNPPQAVPAEITAVVARAITAITGDADPPG